MVDNYPSARFDYCFIIFFIVRVNRINGDGLWNSCEAEEYERYIRFINN